MYIHGQYKGESIPHPLNYKTAVSLFTSLHYSAQILPRQRRAPQVPQFQHIKRVRTPTRLPQLPLLPTKTAGVKRLPKVTSSLVDAPLTQAYMAKVNNRIDDGSPPKHIEEVLDEIVLDNEIFPPDVPVADEIGKQTVINAKRIGLMWPTGLGLKHEAAPLLTSYSRRGCPVDCGEQWSKERIIAALKRGAHKSAKEPEAREALVEDVAEKCAGGFATTVKWKDIKNKLPPNFKLSPAACIPHKSRTYRIIIDLSFNLLFQKRRQTSVNEATNIQAPQKAMAQLGQVVHRLIHLMALHYDLRHPFKFCKIDIKDGFWRMSVDPEDAWNFCYSIPPESPDTPLDDITIVVPSALQMGWAESPPFFCAATETARDIIERLIHNGMDDLPFHPSETKMCQATPPLPPHAKLLPPDQALNLVEVYVDDFIGCTNNLSTSHLTNMSRAILHGIHSIFPHPDVSGHCGLDPVSQGKLDKGEGLWEYEKEVLGWMFNGKDFTLYLPPSKTDKICDTLHSLAAKDTVPLTPIQAIAGKLNHASIGIPNGRALSSPIYQATRHQPQNIRITPYLKQALLDWKTLLRQISKRPTHVLELAPTLPAYIGFVDACKTGIGGVWFSGTKHIQPTVWRLPLPPDIAARLVSADNPEGDITINDLEMAGVLIHWLVLEIIAPESLQYTNVGIFCDNSTTVNWTYKFNSKSSIIAAHLLRALALRQHVHRTSPLLCWSVAGDDNKMADVASRSFIDTRFTKSHLSFLDVFSTLFPLKQPHCWREFHLPTNITTRVISSLRGSPLALESWTNLPKQGANIGLTGRPIVPSSSKNRTSVDAQSSNSVSLLQDLEQEYGLVLTVTESKSKHHPSQLPWHPSPRPASWLDNHPLSTRQMRHTNSQWHGQLKGGDDGTLHPFLNWQYP